MKKRLFVLAAIAAALTMAFGITACDKTQSANSENNTAQTEQEKDVNKLSESEWKTAISDSAANLTNYEYALDTNDELTYADHLMEIKRDDNIVLISLTVSPTTTPAYFCYVNQGSSIRYLQGRMYPGEDIEWFEYGEEYMTDYFKEQLKQGFTYFDKIIFADKFIATNKDGQQIQGTLADLYTAFTYNESGKFYYSELTAISMTSLDGTVTENIKQNFSYKVFAEKGKLLKIEWEGTSDDGIYKYCLTFGGVELTIPKPVN